MPKHAPAHLAPATQRWWREVVNGFCLEAHHVRLLTLAAEAFDRTVQAREAIDAHGLTYLDGDKPRARPEVAIERDARLAFARLVRELDLDTEGPVEEFSRPPAIKSNRG